MVARRRQERRACTCLELTTGHWPLATDYGFLSALVSCGGRGGWAADLDPSAQAASHRSAPVPVADVVRKARAKLRKTPAPGISAAVRAAGADDPLDCTAVCEPIHQAQRSGERQQETHRDRG